MECNKYIKKAKIGIIFLLSIFFVVGLKEVFNSSIYTFIAIVYVIVACTLGGKYIIGYVNCIVNSNRSHKPPFS